MEDTGDDTVGAATPGPLQDLSGRVVLVTGGNGGIGLALARGVARAGADVVIWGRDDAKNVAAADDLRTTGRRVEAFVCDVRDEDGVNATFAASVAAMGRVDTVFANAGVTGRGTPFAQLDLAEWRAVLDVNLDGVFLTLRAAAAHMIERGDGGALVAVSSTSAVHGAAGNEAYGTAKTALLGLTRALAVGLARHRIRVNALVPGWTVTELAGPAFADERFREVTTRRTPVRRWADPAEFEAVGAYLADPSLTFHTGDQLTVDGGYTVF